jgi:hypothetical protein
MGLIKTLDGQWWNARLECMIGKRGRTTRPLTTGLFQTPVGTEVTVTGVSNKGFDVDTVACTHCGVRVRMSKLSRGDIVFLDAIQAGDLLSPRPKASR